MPRPDRTEIGEAIKLLRDKGHNVGRVYRVWSAGESGYGTDVVLYTTMENKPMTALVSTTLEEKPVPLLPAQRPPGKEVKIHVNVREGWDV